MPTLTIRALAAAGLAAAAWAAGTCAADAQAVAVQSVSSEPYGVFDEGYSEMTLNAPGYSQDVLAGTYGLLVNGVMQDGIICIDDAHELNLPAPYYQSLMTSLSPVKDAQISSLLYWAPDTGAVQSAGEQLAGWAIAFQSGLSNYNPADQSRGWWVTNYDPLVMQQAMYDLSLISGSAPAAFELFSPDDQSLAFSPPSAPAGIPEPGSTEVFALAAGFFAASVGTARVWGSRRGTPPQAAIG